MRVELHVVQGRGAPRVIECEVATLADAREAMSRQGFTVLSHRIVGMDWRHALRASSASKPGLDVEVFVEQLRDLLSAGLGVVEALDALNRGASEANAHVLRQLLDRLRNGHRFSEAMAADAAFPALLVALVRSSELTSDLHQALDRFLEHQRRVAELRHRITSVAIYPLLLATVGVLVLLFLLFYVMPRFARVFEGMNAELPWSARAMVWWAQWLNTHGTLVVWALATVVVAGAFVFTSTAARARIGERLINAKLVRQQLRTYFLARWYRTTGMLVEGGIPLPEALGLSNGLLPLGMRAAGHAVERALRDGHSPADAHARAGMVTPVAEQLMQAGERTGDLGTVLTRIAQFHDTEVTRSLERLMRAVEPIVMVAIGVGVGVVVVLMYLPIFELASAIQ
jgi:general secretion pathway protein F